MRSFRKLLSLFALAKPRGTGFFDLPIEIRNEIYQHYFMNCYVRYHRDYDLDKRRIIVKRDYCRGPEEHNLLATCRQIREEGMVVLISQPTYVLIDDVDADVALYRMGSPLMSLFLRTLIASTAKLIMSKPGESMFDRALPNYSLPRFDNLEAVEIFGFYPSLRKWLYRNRTITMGWPIRCWRIGPWETNAVPTKNRRIQLSNATQWVHDITGKDESQLQVRLRAWEYDDPRTATEWGSLFHVIVDMDKKAILEKHQLQTRPKKDNVIAYIQGDCKKYHRFLEATTQRRKAWLRREKHNGLSPM